MKKMTLLVFLIVGLSGCFQHQIFFANKEQAINKIDNYKSCKSICVKKMQICSQQCKNSCYNCSKKSDQMTRKSFHRYIHEEALKGGVITRELNSYRDPLQCRKVTCNCCADFNTCVQACSGVIEKRL